MLLTETDLAARWSVPTGQISTWFFNDGLPGMWLPGGKLRFDESQVDDWLASLSTDPNQEAADSTTVDSVDAVYRTEYALSRSAFEQHGVSESQYVATRRIDDGLAELSVGTSPN